MSAPRYARLASALLARRPSAPLPTSPEARAAAIAAVERALRARARTRRLAAWAAASLAVAAVVAAVVGVRHLEARVHGSLAALAPPAAAAPVARPDGAVPVEIVAHPAGAGAKVVVSGAQGPLSDGRPLAAGSRIVTPASGRAELTFSTGTEIVLGERTDMTVRGEGSTQAFRLDAGAIDLHVAKLSQGERFVVDTSDTEVEVRGTQFRVSIVRPDAACGAGTPTRVSVREGVVVVRHAGAEVRVAAGEQWPAGCGPRLAPVAAAPAARRVAVPPADKAAEVAPSAQATASAASTLAEQNDLFAAAVAAKRRGEGAAALDAFDRFLAEYPTSPLGESARVERMRLLRASSPAQARAAAEQYLAQYPNGFARPEAEALVRGSP